MSGDDLYMDEWGAKPLSDRGHIPPVIAIQPTTPTLEAYEAIRAAETAAEIKDTNPKAAIGVTKVPLHLVSPIMKAYQSIAQFLGNVKYGGWNWRAGGVRCSIYVGALLRHVDKWYEGEELDEDGTPHLANALTCLTMLIEAQYRGVLEDDRPPSTDLKPLYSDIEKMMVQIREKYKDRTPKHWTIKDQVRNEKPLK